MKHLIPFRIYESQMTSGLTKRQEQFLNKYTFGTWSVNPSTGLVDVQGDFDCRGKRLNSLLDISFGHVSGHFNCFNNKLTSLKGSPQTVRGDFNCFLNQLTSLEGAPQTVGGTFYCYNNQLTSLEGAPQTLLKGDFSCSSNQLTSLEGAPQTVGNYFDCSLNHLRTLEGAPQTVGGDLLCQHNLLTSLKGAPQTVSGEFACSRNQLTSLEGAPQTVGGGFDCSFNDLTSLEGAPQTVGMYFSCDEFQLDPGKWNIRGWAGVLNTGTSAAQKLISTLPWIQPEYWNSKLKQEPKATILQIVPIWDDLPKEIQDEIQIPSNWKDSFDSLLDLERAGIF